MLESIGKAIRIIFLWQLSNLILFMCLFIPLIALTIIGAANAPKINKKQNTTIIDEGSASSNPLKQIILEIPVDGIITRKAPKDLFEQQKSAYDRFLSDLDVAEEDPQVAAILLRINSPGGEVSACDRMYQILERFKKRKNIPIFSFYESMAASGGVYCSAGSDIIYASPTCITGSIGVIMGGLKVKNLMDKIGVESRNYQSGKLKDMGSGMRDTSPEEDKLLQDTIDGLFDRFVDIVVSGRGERVNKEDIVNLQGSFFLADKAKKFGLIDEIGSIEDCYEALRKRINLECDIKRYKQKPEWMEMFEGFNASPSIPLIGSTAPFMLEGPLYLLDL
ncbi:MAG: signal peptide peptidase SppA [Planctomycetes bacterium]|nr:signal peptide peptidase SppA [Planctomycetota bacterium]